MSVLEKLEKKHGRGFGPGPQGKLVVQMPTGGKPVRAANVSRETKPRRAKKGGADTTEAELAAKGLIAKRGGKPGVPAEIPTRVKLTVEYDPEFGLDLGSEHDVVEYFPPTGRVSVKADFNAPEIIPVTAFVPIAFAAADSIPAKQRMVPLYGGTLGTPIPSVPGTDAPSNGRGEGSPSSDKAGTSERAPESSPARPERTQRRKGVRSDDRHTVSPSEPSPIAKRTAAQAEASAAAIADLPVTRLPLAQLVRHPKNRKPTAADVDARAESMRERGQLEPLVVHLAADELDDKFEILSGETRWLAAKKLGWHDIAVRVAPQQDEQQALALLALFNAQRTDLTAIEKAQSIKDLCDAGLTREAAAKVHGLESGAAASNLVGLLTLPSAWQELVNEGQLKQTFARLLTPWAAAPKLVEAIEVDRQKRTKSANAWEKETWTTADRDTFEEYLDELVHAHVRPVDGKATFSYERKRVGQYWSGPRLFELTDDVKAKLEIIEMRYEGAKKPIEVATNVREFDRLQIPLVKEKVAAKKKKQNVGIDRQAPAKKLTPAQLKAAKKQRATRLHNEIENWRADWLRELCGAALKPTSPLCTKLALVLATEDNYDSSFADVARRFIASLAKKKNAQRWNFDAADAWDALGKSTKAPLQLLGQAVIEFLKEPDSDPGSTPLLAPKIAEDVAAELDVDLAAAWKAAQAQKDRPRVASFLELHEPDELDELGRSWQIHLEAEGKESKIATLLRVERILPMPKSIKPLASVTKRKRGAK